ncbi:MAG TPA: GNAT family protein [Prolixibacteraceae bacterium]|nr:GNAT family protein [Prolixibacteraceae bacterium]
MDFKLRPWNINDVGNLIKYGNNPNITRFMSDGFSTLFTVEKATAFIEFANSGHDKLYRTIEINGEASGGIGVMIQNDIYRKNAELGYWLAEPFWGNGIVSRAIPLIVEEAFQTFDINRIYATPFSTNKASQKVLERTGFKLEACHEKKVFRGGEYIDELVYVLLR